MVGGYGDFMFQTGLIDEHQRQYVVQRTDLMVSLIQQQKWVEALQVERSSLILSDQISFQLSRFASYF